MYDLFTVIFWSSMVFLAGSLLGMRFSDRHWKAIMILRERQREEAGGDRLNEQLKAIKKLVNKGPSLNVDTLEDCQQAVDDWLGKLMNILEAAK